MLFQARSGRSAVAPASSSCGPAAHHGWPPLPRPSSASRGGTVASAAAGSTLRPHPSPPSLYPSHLGARAGGRSPFAVRANPGGLGAAIATAAAAAASSAATSAAAPPGGASKQQQQQQLVDYVVAGPLLASCGLSAESVRQNAAEWCALGARLAHQLGFAAEQAPAAAAAAAAAAPGAPPPAAAVVFSSLDDTQRLRIYRYYLPVFFWVRAQLDLHAAADGGEKKGDGGAPGAAAANASNANANAPSPRPPLVLGISAPQGCGKTTLTEQLSELFAHLGYRVAGVSIDDFYLTRREQEALALANLGNRLLELRGNAGTHDLALGARCLEALRACTSSSSASAGGTPQEEGAGGGEASAASDDASGGEGVAVPRYDKSAFGGKGDRAPEGAWPRVCAPLQLVLFEGWMLGFRPLGDGGGAVGAAVSAEDAADLRPVDAALRAYEEAWDRLVDSWLVVRVGDAGWVRGWRLQAEQAMRAAGRGGMSDAGVADFVSRYLPAYGAYLPSLYAEGPTTARAGRTLVVEVDERRSPVAAQKPLPARLLL